MTTIAKAVKSIVTNAIDQSYIVDCGFNTLAQVYNAEYGYNGHIPKACKDYLQGLPSVCTIPFSNHKILELLAEQGITRKTEAGKERLVESYWNEAGFQFWKLIK